MTSNKQDASPPLSGRIQASPETTLDTEILVPQFQYELANLLPSYLLVEQAMVTEYLRMGLLSTLAAEEITRWLSEIDQQALQANAESNMSDICFAIERYVTQRLEQAAPAWHVDRSRNDVQATAQLMFARKQLLLVLGELFKLADEVQTLAEPLLMLPIPGYTHYQSAQIITPGFYFSALNEQLGKTIDRLLKLYEHLNECPLGSGAMAGLELDWDCARLAAQLGFSRPVRNALTGVASKEWALLIAAELSSSSLQLGRFVTDLITWGSSEYAFIDLPDQLSGISSAMPQKKNFPILERIRGRFSHITAYHMDLVLGQHNTPFTNLVETAKEGGRNFATMTQSMCSALRLFTLVIAHLSFKEERAYALCMREFFGGFTLANVLTLSDKIPFRLAQTIVGRYIVRSLQDNRQPDQVDLSLLATLCREQGYPLHLSEEEVRQAFAVRESLEKKSTQSSTNPRAMGALLALQKQERVAFYQSFLQKQQSEQSIYP